MQQKYGPRTPDVLEKHIDSNATIQFKTSMKNKATDIRSSDNGLQIFIMTSVIRKNPYTIYLFKLDRYSHNSLLRFGQRDKHFE